MIEEVRTGEELHPAAFCLSSLFPFLPWQQRLCWSGPCGSKRSGRGGMDSPQA